MEHVHMCVCGEKNQLTIQCPPLSSVQQQQTKKGPKTKDVTTWNMKQQKFILKRDSISLYVNIKSYLFMSLIN
jgi:hypothetical protein